MHFALPPRKTSSPPLYTRASTRSAATLRAHRIQYLSYTVLCILTLYLFYKLFFSGSESDNESNVVSQDSSVLMVTVFDEATMSKDYIAMIRTNREHYATRHGYKTFYTNTSTYKNLYDPSPSTWATLPALRNALTRHPETEYIWSLTPHALITNFTLDLYTHILKPLPDLMLKDIPVVPPDSVIHTFSHLTAATTNLILTQDHDNLAHTSFLLRNSLTLPQHPKDTWTQFFLDAWFDPLYRAYAFQKAENHALEHIVQWHPTILANLVIISQRRLNSYNFQYPKQDDGTSRPLTDSMWQEGDLLINFKGCVESQQRDCEQEMRTYFDRWTRDVERIDGKPVDTYLKVPGGHNADDKSEENTTDYELKRKNTQA